MATRSESRQKTEMIQVRCTPEEKEMLRDRAIAFGCSMGELCRETIFRTRPKSKMDQQAVLELAQARADLGRLGGLFKGWLAGSFEVGQPGPKTKEEIKRLLAQIEETQLSVLQTVKTMAVKP